MDARHRFLAATNDPSVGASKECLWMPLLAQEWSSALVQGRAAATQSHEMKQRPSIRCKDLAEINAVLVAKRIYDASAMEDR